ncbi:ABC-2 type transport system ATP-binding protein [Atopostipes suicloacalis DSM 15692]|uniref:ABC-2 type transport system ATP-binding protein n=1 Tax=Atopostipes suicloacalis DSM 15692 TaxID=1121025 RepID=A0A1M4SIE7_9LACT|nr:ABC transporter ATP-binding protein [Atopostipes suicloacalis]SHE31966.1 ABC-2 type transport system ATP-binding protein [Atopostipes suicloacalis DSM 15692]
MSIIQIENLTKSFGQFKALEDVNLEVKQGEIHGFIGPNGAGKSTTIRVLLGMLKADTGNITIFGKDTWQEAVSIHSRIAYVPGDANLWPNLTGGQIIDLFLNMRNSTIDNKRRDELIKYFELDPTKKCRTYSKGNLQKVLIISALASDADIYILDEPTSGLDPLMERKFQNYLLDLKAQGKTILLSSHILSEVEKLCDHVSIIRKGKIIEEGTLEELRHLTRTNFEVTSSENLEGLENIEGIHQVERENTTTTFQVDSENVNEVIQLLSQYKITHLTSAPPRLEDLFIRYYDDQEDEQYD